ncbi:MAG TPA: AcvB/VirJ family lysyl-phosphatidylglycerol hydrolase [Gemmatimonadaceae bacterium]|nr:AcvB/VirJ family lysyl-phosphatidylglycerol hydrolase [Gemmatimonadaceae bacterium]
MRPVRLALAGVLLGACTLQHHDPGGDVADLPLIEIPTTGSDSLFAILITGDGGWAAADRGLAAALKARGVPVVGLDAPRYLTPARTPDESARDLARIIRHYHSLWHRSRVVVIGYSRGADIGPFMVARLPDELRRQVLLVALLGPSAWVGFEYHFIDLLANIHRPGDLPVTPEVERLRGTPVLCIYGRGDRHAICPDLDPSLARPVLRDGGHAVSRGEGRAIVDSILGRSTAPAGM